MTRRKHFSNMKKNKSRKLRGGWPSWPWFGRKQTSTSSPQKNDENVEAPDLNKHFLIVSHQNRIKKVIDPILEFADMKKPDEEIRFMNASILELTLKKSQFDKTSDKDSIMITLNLLYNGNETSVKSNKKYWINTNITRLPYVPKFFNTKRIILTLEEARTLLGIEYDTFTQIVTYDTPIKFLIMRHGTSYHNQTGKYFKKYYKINIINTDTELTEQGEKESSDAGKNIKDMIKQIDPNYIFVSDLKRTIQTATKFLEGYNIDQPNLILLPCNHEILKNKYLSYIGTGENKTSCNLNNNDMNQLCRQPFINPYAYKNFYNNRGRYSKNFQVNAESMCNGTTFINEALKIIFEKVTENDNRETLVTTMTRPYPNDSPLIVDSGESGDSETIGGGRRNKTRRKHKRKHF